MLFNSIDFAIFLPVVFVLYWFVTSRNLRIQNLFLVVASYFFYGWWDWRFLFLILFSTVVDYIIGLKFRTQDKQKYRKLLLGISIIVNIGLLGFFKYYDFFVDNFIEMFTFLGMNFKARSLNIILPVGISFYTFQTLSYTIDIYRKKIIPTEDFIAFAAFVSFFPQLVAGPIERASRLLPQFFSKRNFNYEKAKDGLRQILWGLFKKIVIADGCAEFANLIFNNYPDYNGATLVLGALFFTIQIYGDFSGYSDIAIGTARLFGFNLMQNFAFPYFSRDIAEFWRRWHISLSSWFRDYLYIPIGGSRVSKPKVIRNILIVFIVSGFWHGANWTFIIWGALNAIYFLPLILLKQNRRYLDVVAKGKILPPLREFIGIMITFSLTIFAWIFFRSENLNHAFQYIKRIFYKPFFDIPELHMTLILTITGIFFIIEWIGREGQYAIEKINKRLPVFARWIIYLILIGFIYYFSGKEQQFIYFQF